MDKTDGQKDKTDSLEDRTVRLEDRTVRSENRTDRFEDINAYFGIRTGCIFPVYQSLPHSFA